MDCGEKGDPIHKPHSFAGWGKHPTTIFLPTICQVQVPHGTYQYPVPPNIKKDGHSLEDLALLAIKMSNIKIYPQQWLIEEEKTGFGKMRGRKELSCDNWHVSNQWGEGGRGGGAIPQICPCPECIIESWSQSSQT